VEAEQAQINFILSAGQEGSKSKTQGKSFSGLMQGWSAPQICEISKLPQLVDASDSNCLGKSLRNTNLVEDIALSGDRFGAVSKRGDYRKT
jgi:hypothetical protein